MIHLVLDNLRCLTVEHLPMFLKSHIIVLNFDGTKTQGFTDSVQTQAAFLGHIGILFFQDHRIDHGKAEHTSNDNHPFAFPYHVRSHAYTFLSMRSQRIKQVLGYRQIIPVCSL